MHRKSLELREIYTRNEYILIAKYKYMRCSNHLSVVAMTINVMRNLYIKRRDWMRSCAKCTHCTHSSSVLSKACRTKHISHILWYYHLFISTILHSFICNFRRIEAENRTISFEWMLFDFRLNFDFIVMIVVASDCKFNKKKRIQNLRILLNFQT